MITRNGATGALLASGVPALAAGPARGPAPREPPSAGQPPPTVAEDTLRAIGAGEVDAFVVSDGGTGRRVVRVETADQPDRMFVESMRGGAATLSSNGEPQAEPSNGLRVARRTLQSALDDRRIIVHYQPVIDLSSGRVAGFEALARIAERDGSILSPAAFVPVAEETGLVVPLGAQVLAMACEEARRWQPAGFPGCPLSVAVNLSSRQLGPGDLTTLVRAQLERTGLDPACLHLELTETAVIDLVPEILEQLSAIRELGVQIGLDDFGTGYASMTHLRRLPLTFVKIDQSFVQGLGTDDEDDRIVSAVIDLAAHLGLRSIAEGVETEGQRARLRQYGCDQAQGYLFARPLPAGDVPTAITRTAW